MKSKHDLYQYERAWILACLITLTLTVAFTGCALAWHAWGHS